MVCRYFNGKKYYPSGNGYYRNRTTLHRDIWEAIHGEKLKAGDVVHHIDGNKENNNPENLERLTDIEHRMKHKRTRFKLQPEVILQIHEMRKKGATKAKISMVLHIANSTVCDRLSVKKRNHIRKNFN